MSDEAVGESGTGTRRRKERVVWSVGRLSQEVERLLQTSFGNLWLEGELSNVARPASGHLYFSIKDSHAQIRCAMFKGRNRYVEFRPDNGDAVLVRGRLGLYAARGDFQLIVDHMEPAGAGRLQAAFERRKTELAALGWFDASTKRPLPPAPRRIGIVTSPTGAALRDVLHVLARRYPQGEVILYPTVTQAAQSAPEIARALGRAARRGEVDVLLLVRGGGSLEDLWGFNETVVAEAIRGCPMPVIAGVGHETDVTIADLVADLRAPTPSAAAELAVPDGAALAARALELGAALSRVQARRLGVETRRLGALGDRLAARRPQRLLVERARHLDELQARLHGVRRAESLRLRTRLQALAARLDARRPDRLVDAAQRDLEASGRRLRAAIERRLSNASSLEERLARRLRERSPAVALAAGRARHERARLGLDNAARALVATRAASLDPLARALDAVGPMAVLRRGYAVLESDGRVVSSIRSLSAGDRIVARLADGKVDARVSDVAPGDDVAEREPDREPSGSGPEVAPG